MKSYVLQASALRHAGHHINSGERWVMVLFLMPSVMRFGEHVRHFKARASMMMEEGDYEGMAHLSKLARTLCDDSDHDCSRMTIAAAPSSAMYVRDPITVACAAARASPSARERSMSVQHHSQVYPTYLRPIRGRRVGFEARVGASAGSASKSPW